MPAPKTTKTRKTAAPTTRTVAGHPLTLTPGRTYQAGRAMMGRRDLTTYVSITDVTDGITNAPVVAMVEGLTYEAANLLLNEFNGSAATGFRRAW